jgi:hypothetical protein
MKRRTFIAGLGSAAAWPVVARAQQPPTPVIGLLQIGAPSSWDFTGFRQGLKDVGYLEGQNYTIDVRWANDDADRLAGLVADLVPPSGPRDRGFWQPCCGPCSQSCYQYESASIGLRGKIIIPTLPAAVPSRLMSQHRSRSMASCQTGEIGPAPCGPPRPLPKSAIDATTPMDSDGPRALSPWSARHRSAQDP